MELFHISAECYPVAKVGGLADVVGALPKYQNQLGHHAKVVVPGYDNKFTNENEFDNIHNGKLRLGNFIFNYSVLREKTSKLGFELYLIAIPELFDRPNVYSYDDDTERFTAFQIAFLNWLVETDQHPDLIHCHDHHTGLIPFMVQFCYNYETLNRTPTVLTIHNGQYQGWFGFDKLHYIPDFNRIVTGFLDWGGTINPLAAAIKCAWKVTTVSPSYLDEISNNANGLESLLRYERPKSIGILNGIDTEVWDTNTDPMLETNYSLENFKAGKAANKRFLCEQFNLDPEKPLFTFIGRLVGEKGADLLPEICSVALNYNPKEINILILGSGDPIVENALQSLQQYHSGNYNAYIGYNEKLAHIVYGGADFLLMPSRVEPCGLNQMYALRYGTVPIVRRTGGLKDTVVDIGNGGFGICHDNVSVYDVNHSITRGIDLYNDKTKFDAVRTTAMQIDHSWEKAAAEYISVYQSIKN
ncbi:glycogen synthase [Flavobacterium noncentrifugens]|uniref:Glycogen synthase n=1 Tax=Flavobacterium noncentrifugens TaxID=1128970 RepID=A0A1G8YPA3_9FLAO|nr:glycogen synthase [Flavobacterium noncentrifugens]SDK04591.1 starch synthase [Flavobacterium noncentrifugens]